MYVCVKTGTWETVSYMGVWLLLFFGFIYMVFPLLCAIILEVSLKFNDCHEISCVEFVGFFFYIPKSFPSFTSELSNALFLYFHPFYHSFDMKSVNKDTVVGAIFLLTFNLRKKVTCK